MRVAVFGLGYVGSVTAACLADLGHEVIGVDIDRGKLAAFREGHAPVPEEGLDDLILRNIAAGRLQVTDNVGAAVVHSELSLVCVGTPSRRNGSLDTGFVERVVSDIAQRVPAGGRHVIVVRSTVLPGTSAQKLIPVIEKAAGESGADIGYAVNPEFMREGQAIRDFHNASFVVIGAGESGTHDVIARLYADSSAPIVRTSIEVAEMVKYASNTFHALKVAFANEIGALAHAHGVDGREVMELFRRDSVLNVSGAYLRPGFAFGGSCLPKDTRALAYRARETDVETPVLASILRSNEAHIRRAIDAVEAEGQRRVLVVGLSFKPGTDDVRESPFVLIAEALIGRGYEVAILDPDVDLDALVGMNRAYIEHELPHIASIVVHDVDEAVKSADSIVVGKDLPGLAQALKAAADTQVVFDLTGVVDRHTLAARYEALCW